MRIAIVVFLFCIESTSPLFACLCSPPSVNTSLQNSDMVFSGLAISLSEIPEERTTSFFFSVSRIWKGGATDTITITTPSDVGSCGFNFLPGKEYLVYAKSKGNTYSTNMCTRSCLLEKVATDLFLLPKPIYSVGELGVNVPTAEAFINEQLWKLENQNSGNTYQNLMDLIEYHQLLVPELTRIAEGNIETDNKGQRLAIKVLGSFGYHSRSAIPVLLGLLSNENNQVRVAAQYTLVNIFPEGFQVHPELFDSQNPISINELSRGVSELREIEFGVFPPDSLFEHGGKTGPLYIIRNPLWE